MLLILVNLSLQSFAQNLKVNKDLIKNRPAHHINTPKFDLPKKTIKYLWNNVSKTYVEDGRGILKYNNLGDILSKTYYTLPSDSLYRSVFKYDALGHLIETHYQNQNTASGGKWINSAKQNFIKDKNDATIEYIFSNWISINNTWEIDKGYRNEYVYDVQGRKIKSTYIKFSQGNWINQSQDIYTYANANAIGYNTFTELVWSNNSWVFDYRYIDIDWKDATSNERTKYTKEEFINNSWILTKRLTTLTNNTDYVKLYESNEAGNWVFNYRYIITDNTKIKTKIEIGQQFTNGQWVNQIKNQETYDDGRGNPGGYTQWQWINNDWELEYSYSFLFDIKNRLIEEGVEQYSLLELE